jgi:hypothetical protein
LATADAGLFLGSGKRFSISARGIPPLPTE